MRRPQGFALIAALVVMLLLGVLGVTLAGLYSTQAKTVVEAWKGQRALAVADSGLRWVFAQQFDNDRDFSDNVSPTDAPYGANAMDFFGAGKFWVQYGPTQTQTEVDLTVTAQVEDVVRVVKSRLRLKAALPLRHVLYASGGINLIPNAASAGTVTGDVETEGSFSPAPPGGLTYVGSIVQNSPYRRFQGVNVAFFSGFAEETVTGNLTLTAGPTYGNVAGYLWYVVAPGNLILQGPGAITIDGSVVLEGGQLIVQGSPTVTWTARAKNLDGDPALEMPPAFVADSVDIQAGSNMTVNGLACSRVGVFQWTTPFTFNLTGLLLARGAVSAAGVAMSTLNMTYDSQWNTPWGLDAPWLLIAGPDVEYELAQWREQVSP